MKQVLQTETACMNCDAPKVKKEYKNVKENGDSYEVKYETYIVNHCTKCGKKYAKLI